MANSCCAACAAPIDIEPRIDGRAVTVSLHGDGYLVCKKCFDKLPKRR